jgi:gamma-glutamyltranspeptidase
MTAFEYETTSSFEDEESDLDDAVVDIERKGSIGRVPLRSFCVLLCTVVSILIVSFLGGWFSRTLLLTEMTTATTTTTNEDEIFKLKEYSAIDNLQNGAVASDHEVCSRVGVDLLRKGGNAVDAAVATTLCLGVANPASSGLGGGAFILIHSSRSHHEARYDPRRESPGFDDKRDHIAPSGDGMVTEVIDCRETAPAAATQDMYAGKPRYASAVGGLAVAVPGELRGLELAHARHGSMSWADVVEPALQLARDGVPVSAHLAGDIQGMKDSSKSYGDLAAIRRFLTKHDDWDSGFEEGELLRNPQLAETLSRISIHGSKAFYEGDLADIMAKDVQAEGGILTAEDLRNYVPVLRSPVFGTASGYTLVGVPPPSSGGAAVIGAARFLSGYSLPLASSADALAVHRTAEAMRHVFAIRMSLSDPAFFVNKTAHAVQDLTSSSYMESLRNITKDDSTLPLSQYGGTKWAQLNDDAGAKEVDDAHEGDRRNLRQPNSVYRTLARRFGYLNDFGTTHLSVVDKDGNAVAITSSVNNIFGSHVFSEATGVLLGNTMDDFGNPGRSNFYGLAPSEENFIYPGKRVSIGSPVTAIVLSISLFQQMLLSATIIHVPYNGISQSRGVESI